MPKGIYVRKNPPSPPINIPRPWQERFAAKVVRSVDPDGCDIWTGAVDGRGYGKLQLGTMRSQRTGISSRLAWEMEHGAPPDGMVLHRCDNRRCVKPSHLFLGTAADNAADKVSKGRQTRGAEHPMAKLTDEQVAEIRAMDWGITNAAAVARRYGISEASVSNVRHGRTYRP